MIDVACFNGEASDDTRPAYHTVPWYDALLACTACPIRQEARRVVPGAGPVDARLLFVGQNPGIDEDVRGVSFIGLSGDELASWLLYLGVARDKVIVTNVVKCHTERNRTPRPREIETCQNLWLRRELETFTDVQVVVPLGRPALYGLVGKVSPLPDVLDFWWMDTSLSDTRQIKIIPLPHPSYLLRFPGQREHFFTSVLQPLLSFFQSTEVLRDVYQRSRT